VNGVRRVWIWFALALGVAVAHADQEKPRYTERVDVERVLVDARVLDSRGQAIAGLAADDFRVRIGGKPVAIESVTWVGGAKPESPSAEVPAPSPAAEELLPGRLIIFVFQKDFFESSRIVGFMRMLMETQTFLNDLTPQDRVAVVSFDSRLRIWLDFTSDREAVRRVLRRGILFEEPRPSAEWPDVSLMTRLNPQTASKTYTIEKALQHIADAVRGLPGSKSIVFVGHGFGRLGSTGVTMERDYDEARDALLAARATVFTLDVTQADYHSLEAGLQSVSRHTGGSFARTHLFPEQAMKRLAGALTGYYVLVLEQPQVEPGTHDVEVRLTRRQGTVLARDIYTRPALVQ
jgi:VWFA-related protein